jgi:hypothetical protein
MVFKVFKKLFTTLSNINFVFASLKLLDFENAFWNPTQYSLLCDWSMFSSTDLSLAEVKCARNNLSQAASGMISQSASSKHFQRQNCRFRVFEEVSRRNSKLVSSFKGAS